jgi:Ni/Co efflux regulator RcnB
MKITTIVAAVTALTLGCANVAFAQGRNDNDPGHSRGPGQQARDVQARPDTPQRRAAPAPAARYRPAAPDRRMGDGRGAGPDHSFYRGGRLPPQYRSNQYVVDDWRGHHLNAPPRGYHWVQTGGDYVLVAIATGLIASILLNQ